MGRLKFSLKQRFECVPRGGSLLLCVALLIVCSHSEPAKAQELPKIPQIQPFGIDGFRLMLQQRGLQATPDRVGTALNEKPKETVAIVMGNLKTVTEGGGVDTQGRGIQEQLEKFVLNGGNLLVASDLRGQRLRPATICGTWVQDLKVWLKTESEIRRHAYQSTFHDCPVVTRFDTKLEPTLFEGVTQLVANRPSFIIHSRVLGVRFKQSSEVAWLPTRNRPPLIAVQRPGKGKMLFVADHSLFMNEMLVHGDNARFVNNVTKWLSDGEQRRRLVLINDGNVLPNWTFGDSPPSIPLSSLLRAARYGSLANLPVGDSLLPFLNESISRSQQENELNGAVRKAAFAMAGGRGLRFGVLVTIAVLVASFLAWLVGTRWVPQRWLSLHDWQLPRR